MHVLHIAWDGDLGGVQRYLLKVLEADTWQGTKHSVCLLSRSGRVLNEDQLRQVSLHELRLTGGSQVLRARRLITLAEEVKADLIHAHCDTPALFTSLGSLSRWPIVYHEHGDTLMREGNRLITDLIWRWQHRRVSKIVAISKYVATELHRRYPYLEKKTVTVSNPLIELLPELPPKETTQALKVGYVGRLAHQKGSDRILDLAEMLRDQEISFEVFGEGPLKESMSHRSGALPVTLHGFNPQPLARMAECDVLVVPSRIEPFGLVAVESLSVGTPVLGFRDSGLEEIIRDDHTGWLFDQGDLSSMANKLRALSTDRTSLVAVGDAARKLALKSFSLKAHIENLKKVYKDVSSP